MPISILQATGIESPKIDRLSHTRYSDLDLLSRSLLSRSLAEAIPFHFNLRTTSLEARRNPRARSSGVGMMGPGVAPLSVLGPRWRSSHPTLPPVAMLGLICHLNSIPIGK